MKAIPEEHVQALVDMGFTSSEAEVYLFLLTDSPASGYRIAKAIGRPAAQTYRALEALARKGAVLIAEDKTREWRAVPVERCLANLDRGFQDRRRRAASALRRLPQPADDERVYRLTSRDQVLEQCRTMMSKARQVVLLDLFPLPFQELREDVEALGNKGLALALQLYEKIDMPGATLNVIPADAHGILNRWPGQGINLVVDGREYLSALLTRDGRGVQVAFWSANRYLAAMQHNGLSCEISLSLLVGKVRKGTAVSDLGKTLDLFEPFLLTKSPAMDAINLPEQE